MLGSRKNSFADKSVYTLVSRVLSWRRLFLFAGTKSLDEVRMVNTQSTDSIRTG